MPRSTLAAALALALGASPTAPPPSSPAADTAAGPLWVELRNVRLHVDASAVMRVVDLRGQAVATTPGAVVVLDDPRSFVIDVSAGSVALDGDALGALLNEVVFAYPHAPFRKLRARVTSDGLVQSGILRKGVDLPFAMHASLALTSDGLIRVHPTSMRLLGVDGEKLMRALKLHLKDLVDTRGAKGVRVDGDDLLLDPLALMPPPTVRGRVSALRIADGALVLEFARTPADSVFVARVHPDTSVSNYVYFRGGRIRFGRLEMRDTDLLIADENASDPFDLYLAHYAEQLAAGWSRTMPNAALRVTMPDYTAVAAR